MPNFAPTTRRSLATKGSRTYSSELTEEQRKFTIDMALDGIATADTLPRGSRIVEFRQGETIIERRGRAHYAFFVVRGAARAFRGERRCMRVQSGFCINQEAVIGDLHHVDRVVAEQDMLMVRVPAGAFRRWVAANRKLRALVEVQGLMVSAPGTWTTEGVRFVEDGADVRAEATAADETGARFCITKSAGRDAGSFELLRRRGGESVGAIQAMTERQADGVERRVHFDAERRIVKIEAEGELAGIRGLCKRAVFGRSLRQAAISKARLQNGGCATEDLLCRCARVSREQAKRMTTDQLLASGAGSFCGSCVSETRKLRGCETAACSTEQAEDVEEVQVAAAPSPNGMPYREWFEKAMRGQWHIPKAVDVRRKLEQDAPHLFAADNLRTIGSVAWMVFRLVATGAGILWAINSGNHIAMTLLWGLQGLNVYATLALVHDFSHGVGFSRSSWNRVAGTVLAASYGHRFHSFRWSHLQHHVASQSENDPKGSGGTPMVVRKMTEWWLRGISPLPAFLQKAIVNGGLAVFMLPLGAIIYATDYEFSPLRRVRTLEDWIDVLAIAAVFVVPAIVLGPAVAAMLLLPPLVIGYGVLSVGFLTHVHEYSVSLDTGENRHEDMELMSLNINNLTLGRFLDWFLIPLHRYHVEHHLFPSVPHHRLKELSERIEPYYGALKLPVRAPTMQYIRRGLLIYIVNVDEFWIDGRKWHCGPLWKKVGYGRASELTYADFQHLLAGKAFN